MKKIIIALVMLAGSLGAKAQFPTTDSLKSFVNRWIRNSAVEAFQNLRLNTALIGISNFIDSSYGGQVKSFTSPNDSTARLITIANDTFDVVIRGNPPSVSLNNVGSGFRLLKTPNGNFKTLFAGYGVTIDSSSNSDGITFKIDTSSTNHLVTQSDLNDAVATIPTLRTGDTIIYMSRSSGIVSDADISPGSTTFGTDNTTAAQAVLDIASHTQGLHLVWDVRISTTGLRIGPNTFIQALPSYGAILRNNSDKPLFRNRDTAFGREPVDSNITVQGGIWNGNSFNSGLNPAQAVGTPSNGTTAVFSFYGVRNLIVRDFIIYRQRTYAIAGNNLKNALYENGVIDAGNGGIFSDGVHFDGNSEHCTARNLKIKAIDDAIGINADDAYDNASSPVYGYFPASAAGPVSDISIEDIFLDNGQFGVRILSGSSRVDNIRIKNLTGSTIGYAVVIDNFYQDTSVIVNSGVGNVGRVQIENIDVDITNVPGFAINQAMISLRTTAESIILKDLKRYRYTYPSISTVRVTGSYSNIKSLVIDGYDAIDTTIAGIEHILIEDATINSLSVQRVNLKRNTQGSGLIGSNNATINKIQVNNAVLDSINYVYFNSNSTVSSMTVDNVNHISRMWGTYNTVNNSGGTITSIAISNYLGSAPTMGTIGSKIGDAFPASTTQPGYVTTGTQDIGGNKDMYGRTLFIGSLRVPVPVENSFIDAYSTVSGNDAMLFRNSSLGATVGVQNSNASGFSGIEYLSEGGVSKVFSGLNNANGQEFRFNNFTSGGYINFMTGGNIKMAVNNTGGITLNRLSAPISTYNVLVHGLTDSIVYQVPASALTGITSINSQTGPAVTISAGTAITTSTLSNDITIAYNRTSSDVPHTIANYLTDVNNSGTTETDLYNTTVAANKLISNGQSIHFIGTVFESDITATTQIRVYFAGTEIANTGGISISATGYLRIVGEIIRTTSTTARASFKVEGNGLATDYVNEFDLTSLDFTTTNVFKVTGTAGGASGGSNDITAKLGKLTFQSN